MRQLDMFEAVRPDTRQPRGWQTCAFGLTFWNWPLYLPAPQMVQPFWFGEPAYKATGWYLRGLPALAETNRLPEPERGSEDWKSWNAVHRMPPGPDRARLRSRSFPGMMNAAADQWGGWAIQRAIQSP